MLIKFLAIENLSQFLLSHSEISSQFWKCCQFFWLSRCVFTLSWENFHRRQITHGKRTRRKLRTSFFLSWLFPHSSSFFFLLFYSCVHSNWLPISTFPFHLNSHMLKIKLNLCWSTEIIFINSYTPSRMCQNHIKTCVTNFSLLTVQQRNHVTLQLHSTIIAIIKCRFSRFNFCC